MKVLGVIPARGGSKGVPRKNIRLLAGKPLLVWTVEAALAAKRLTRVILSTDDEEIAAVGRAAGVEVPFLRPAELATDAAPTLPVVQHAIQQMEARGDRFDSVCLLQPTAPLRRAEWIDSCIAVMAEGEADSVVTVLRVPAEHNPHWVYFKDADGGLRLSTGEAAPIPRRQDLPGAFHREGSVYVTRRDVVMEGGSLYGAKLRGVEVAAESSVNIDTEADWVAAERILAELVR